MVKELVYFVTYDDAMWRAIRPVIKIGFTNDLKSRLRELSTASPMNLIAAGTVWSKSARALESRFHSQFRKNRLNGEWFELNPAIISEIRKYDVVDDRFDDLFKFDISPVQLEISALENKIIELNKQHTIDQTRIAALEEKLKLYLPTQAPVISDLAKQVRLSKMIKETKKFARSMV